MMLVFQLQAWAVKMQSITDFSLIHIYASDTKKNNRKKLKNKKKQFSILKAKKSFLQLLKFRTKQTAFAKLSLIDLFHSSCKQFLNYKLKNIFNFSNWQLSINNLGRSIQPFRRLLDTDRQGVYICIITNF